MKAIICAIDGSEHAMRAAEQAAELSKRYGVPLSLVHVVEPYAPPVDLPGMSFVDLIEPQRKAAGELVARAAKELKARLGVEAQTEVRLGSPGAEIVHAAEDRGADLIVVGSRGHGAVKRLLMGSVADRVVHLAQGSVLVVR